MLQKTRELLKQKLLAWEGCRSVVYDDHNGIPTIGIGHNLKSNPLPQEIIDAIYEYDARNATLVCRDNFSDFESFTPNRQVALIAMAFQLGQRRFQGFKQMLQAVNAGDWDRAAAEALDSDAARDPLLRKRFSEYHDLLKHG